MKRPVGSRGSTARPSSRPRPLGRPGGRPSARFPSRGGRQMGTGDMDAELLDPTSGEAIDTRPDPAAKSAKPADNPPREVAEPWAQETLGTGPIKCVWLHGWGQERGSLSKLAMQLGDRGKHRLYDQPGFGKTPMLAAGSGTTQYARNLLPQLPDEPVVLVGHSFGARVAIRLAYSNPEKVRALVLIAGAGLQRKKTAKARLRTSVIRTLGKLARFADSFLNTDYTNRHRERFGSPDYKAAGKLRPTFVKVVNEDLSPLARRISVPVLLIYGDQDTETPPEFGARYRLSFPDAQLHVLPGYGHLDILTRGSYQVEAHIRPFFDRLEKMADSGEKDPADKSDTADQPAKQSTGTRSRS